MICPFNVILVSAKTPGSTCLFSQHHQSICGCVSAREVFSVQPSLCCRQWELWRGTNKSQKSLTSSEYMLNGKMCLKIQRLDKFIHSFNDSKHAQNKLLWVMMCTVKHSVYSSVVERLMITKQNNLLTRGRPESAATVKQFYEAAEPLPRSKKIPDLSLNTNIFWCKTNGCWIKQSVNTKTSSQQTTEGCNKTACNSKTSW